MRPTGIVTGVAEDWPGVGIHSTCADVTASIPLSFLYDAGTDGRLICLNHHSKGKLMESLKKEINEDLHPRKRALTSSRLSLFGNWQCKSFPVLAIVCGRV